MVQVSILLVYQMVYVEGVWCSVPSAVHCFHGYSAEYAEHAEDCGVGCYWDGVFVGTVG